MEGVNFNVLQFTVFGKNGESLTCRIYGIICGVTAVNDVNFKYFTAITAFCHFTAVSAKFYGRKYLLYICKLTTFLIIKISKRITTEKF